MADQNPFSNVFQAQNPLAGVLNQEDPAHPSDPSVPRASAPSTPSVPTDPFGNPLPPPPPVNPDPTQPHNVQGVVDPQTPDDEIPAQPKVVPAPAPETTDVPKEDPADVKRQALARALGVEVPSADTSETAPEGRDITLRRTGTPQAISDDDRQAKRAALLQALNPTDNDGAATPLPAPKSFLEQLDAAPIPGKPGEEYAAERAQGKRPFLSEKAEAAGVGTESAGLAARFDASLALGSAKGEDEQLHILANSLTRDTGHTYEPGINVRVGPLTKELEWLPPGEKTWQLFAGAGLKSALGDIVSAFPEAGVTTAGVAGGVAGGAAGSLLGGYGTPAGGVAGTGLAEAVGEYYRLNTAKSRGVIDWDDEKIFDRAVERGIKAAGTTAVAGFLFGAMRRMALGIKGYDKKLAGGITPGAPNETPSMFGRKAPANVEDSVKSGLAARDEVVQEARDATGRQDLELPVSVGQAAGAQEALDEGTDLGASVGISRKAPLGGASARDAEKKLVRSGQGDALVAQKVQQAQTMEAVDYASLGPKDGTAVTQGGEAVQQAILQARARGTRGNGTDVVTTRLGMLGERAKKAADSFTRYRAEPSQAGRDIQKALTDAREQVFVPFRAAYDKIARESGVHEIDLTTFRERAKVISDKYRQGVLPAVNPAGKAARALKQAETAGLREVEADGAEDGAAFSVERQNAERQFAAALAGTDPDLVAEVAGAVSEPQSLATVSKMISGLKLAQREAQEGGRRQESAILSELTDAAIAARDESLPNTVRTAVNNLDRAYRDNITKFDYGKIGAIVANDGRGNFNMPPDTVIEGLLDSPVVTRDFVESLNGFSHFDPQTGKTTVAAIPGAGHALRAAQDGVLGLIYRKFYNVATRKWDNAGLEAFLQKNDESLGVLFREGEKKLGALTTGVRTATIRNVRTVAQATRAAAALEKEHADMGKAFDEKFGVYTSDPGEMLTNLVSTGKYQYIPAAIRITKQILGDAGADKVKVALQYIARKQIMGAQGKITAQGIETWLEKPASREIVKALGDGFEKNLTTYSKLLRIVEQQAGPLAGNQLSGSITRNVPGLTGLLRYARVIFPPLTARSRALSATLGIVNEQSQRRMAEALANPEKFVEMMRLARSTANPRNAIFRQQMARLGMGHVIDFWDDVDKNDGLNPENWMSKGE